MSAKAYRPWTELVKVRSHVEAGNSSAAGFAIAFGTIEVRQIGIEERRGGAAQ